MGVKQKFRLPMLKGVVCLENSRNGPIFMEQSNKNPHPSSMTYFPEISTSLFSSH